MLPSSANQYILEKVCLRSNLSRKSTIVRVNGVDRSNIKNMTGKETAVGRSVMLCLFATRMHIRNYRGMDTRRDESCCRRLRAREITNTKPHRCLQVFLDT
jgi:hypothetical protein